LGSVFHDQAQDGSVKYCTRTDMRSLKIEKQ